MTREGIIARFCQLQAEVAHRLEGRVEFPSRPADCFCWDKHRGGLGDWMNGQSFRNDGLVLEWIERVIREAIDKELGA